LNISRKRGSLKDFLDGLDARSIERIWYDWQVWAREDQLPPIFEGQGGQWRNWLVMGGRGSGKTRTGAEWVRAQAMGYAPLADEVCTRIALVGETIGAVRSVMVEGVSGLLSIHPECDRPKFEPSKNQLIWPNGSIAQIFSAENPAGLRGPQFSAAWCDEICKWRFGVETWDMLQFGLRLGGNPRVVVTTTPMPIELIKTILANPTTVVSRSSTMANVAHLSTAFLDEVQRRYGNSRLGRQELDGEIIEERDDALWVRDWFEQHRVVSAPDLARIVVAVDPPVTSGKHSDACGIVIAGRGLDGRCYVLADRSTRGQLPLDWARGVICAYRDFRGDCIVAEVNQGGDLVENLLRQVDQGAPIKKVHATRGKLVRAEPISALYARGLVSHVGAIAKLEDQLCDFGPNGLSSGRSPDRLDALVWAVTELMLVGSHEPKVRLI